MYVSSRRSQVPLLLEMTLVIVSRTILPLPLNQPDGFVFLPDTGAVVFYCHIHRLLPAMAVPVSVFGAETGLCLT